MFETIFSSEITFAKIMLMVCVAVACGILSSFLFSLKTRSSKGFFITAALIPAVVAAAFCFFNVMIKTDSALAISGIAAIMVGMGLIRFRSAQGKAEEMLVLFVSVATGAICGLGYLSYAAVFAALIPALYIGLAASGIFKNKKASAEKTLKITIPENLEYNDAFSPTFARYLKEYEPIGVKTTNMGSMFRLSFRIVFRNVSEEKALIDELRTKNGNLEISVLPYEDEVRSL